MGMGRKTIDRSIGGSNNQSNIPDTFWNSLFRMLCLYVLCERSVGKGGSGILFSVDQEPFRLVGGVPPGVMFVVL